MFKKSLFLLQCKHLMIQPTVHGMFALNNAIYLQVFIEMWYCVFDLVTVIFRFFKRQVLIWLSSYSNNHQQTNLTTTVLMNKFKSKPTKTNSNLKMFVILFCIALWFSGGFTRKEICHVKTML